MLKVRYFIGVQGLLAKPSTSVHSKGTAQALAPARRGQRPQNETGGFPQLQQYTIKVCQKAAI